MGTDFTYDEMGDLNIENFTYNILRRKRLMGSECYHVEMIPKMRVLSRKLATVVRKCGYGPISG